MFTALLNNLKENRRTIVFTEGPDARIQEAAARLMKEDLMDVILVGNVEEVKAAAEKNGFDISGATVLDPANYDGMDEMTAKMVELLTPKGTRAKVEIVYQTLGGLREACPSHTGDWYFSGDYPTPGGVKLVNQAFIDYIEKVYQF